MIVRYVIYLVLLASPAFAATDCQDPFVSDLLDSGDGFRALTELKRKEFAARRSPQGKTCAREILRLYVENREFAAADTWLDRLTPLYSLATPAKTQLRAELAFTFGNYTEAQERSEPATFESKTRLQYAAEVFNAPQAAPTTQCHEAVCQQLRKLQDEPQWKQTKSPGLALALGIVPGLGQIYAGRTGAGLASFLLNGTLIGLTVYGSQHGEPALAWLTGLSGTALYAGNLYAGYEAAHRHNEALTARFRERARQLDFKWKLLEWNW